MRLLKKIIMGILIFLVIAYLCLNIFVVTKGKALLSKSLSEILGKEVSLGSLYLSPICSININNLKIEDFLVADRLNLEPSLTGLLLGKIGLNRLIVIRPLVSIVRTGNTEFNVNKIIASIIKNQNKENPQLSFVKQAVIKSARLSFQDKVTGSSFDIVPIEVAVNTSLLDFKTRFDLSAQVVSGDGRNLGNIKGDGWLNFLRKDMDAKFSLNDVELVYFSTYFKNFFRGLKSGKLLFNADAVSKNNDLRLDCHLETHGLNFGDEPLIVDSGSKEATMFGNISGLILNTLLGPGSGGIFDFSIHTKFDNPKIEGLQFKGNIFKEPIKNIMENPKETIEQFKKVGEDFKKVGKELKEQFKDIGDIFKGKSKETEESAQENVK